MHSQKQILLMIVLAALVMRGPINAVGPMASVVRDVFDLPWEAFGVLAGIPTMAFGLCSLAVLPLVAGSLSRNADSERFNRGPERLGSLCHQGGLS